MACRQYYDGLCMGGNCRTCKYDDLNQKERGIENNKTIGWTLIAAGFMLGVTMALVLA